MLFFAIASLIYHRIRRLSTVRAAKAVPFLSRFEFLTVAKAMNLNTGLKYLKII